MNHLCITVFKGLNWRERKKIILLLDSKYLQSESGYFW